MRRLKYVLNLQRTHGKAFAHRLMQSVYPGSRLFDLDSCPAIIRRGIGETLLVIDYFVCGGT